jgi:uncharacterized protein YjbI with pentapeptide repeats
MKNSKFFGCTFSKTNLSNSDLTQADLSMTIYCKIKVGHIQIHHVYRFVTVGRCDMTDVILIGAKLTNVDANNIKIVKSELNVIFIPLLHYQSILHKKRIKWTHTENEIKQTIHLFEN